VGNVVRLRDVVEADRLQQRDIAINPKSHSVAPIA
jgi:hypothetical protein